MGLWKRIFIENYPAYEVERQRYREELRDHISQFRERLSLVKYCVVEGKRRLDRTWSMAVVRAISELNPDSVTINNGEFFKNTLDRDAVKALAEEKHSILSKELGLKPPKRCSYCGNRMRKRLARKGARAGTHFWGCSTYPECRHTEELEN